MKITDVRTRVVEWRGKTVPPQPHFCTNPMDLLDLPSDSMSSFRFYGWLIVEVFTDSGLVGIGNAALSPRVTKQVVDLYLKPLLIGKDPFDYEYLWQHMYRQTMAFGRKGVGMVAISAVDIAIWDVMGKSTGQPVFKLLGGRTKPKIPVYASRLYSQPLDELAREAESYKQQGYRAMKLGPVIGEPTAGWIIYTTAAGLLDGTTLRVPFIRITDSEGKDMELHPRPVDVRVDRPIGEGYTGKDTQLDAAVAELLKRLATVRP